MADKWQIIMDPAEAERIIRLRLRGRRGLDVAAAIQGSEAAVSQCLPVASATVESPPLSGCQWLMMWLWCLLPGRQSHGLYFSQVPVTPVALPSVCWTSAIFPCAGHACESSAKRCRCYLNCRRSRWPDVCWGTMALGYWPAYCRHCRVSRRWTCAVTTSMTPAQRRHWLLCFLSFHS